MRFALGASALLVSLSALSAQQPAVRGTDGVLNSASFAKGQAVAPGSLVSIFGSNLASSTAQADSVPLSTTLGGASVTINGIAAPMLYASSGQLNVQVPWNALADGQTLSTVNLVVTQGNAQSAAAPMTIGQLAPGIFTFGGGTGYAIAINLDGTIAAPTGGVPGVNCRPAKPGDALIILATGLGAVDTPVPNGAASTDVTRNAKVQPLVFIGGQPAQVLFAGLQPLYPGVNQINVIVPNVPAGNSIPLQIEAGGIRSTDQAIVAVSQ
jgi:uncharacterized protein (TIGR03437 family)